MTAPKQLPQKFAAIVDARSTLLRYVMEAAISGELELPERWHIADLKAEVRTERFGDGLACLITGTVTEGGPT
jgi:hypothetical protein